MVLVIMDLKELQEHFTSFSSPVILKEDETFYFVVSLNQNWIDNLKR